MNSSIAEKIRAMRVSHTSDRYETMLVLYHADDPTWAITIYGGPVKTSPTTSYRVQRALHVVRQREVLRLIPSLSSRYRISSIRVEEVSEPITNHSIRHLAPRKITVQTDAPAAHATVGPDVSVVTPIEDLIEAVSNSAPPVDLSVDEVNDDEGSLEEPEAVVDNGSGIEHIVDVDTAPIEGVVEDVIDAEQTKPKPKAKFRPKSKPRK